MPSLLCVAEHRYRLSPSSRGGLSVWEWPQEGRQYVVGIDTAGGGPESDYSVACVIEAETQALVAMWRERMGPVNWGRKCCLLGWYYHEGLLAFETGVSAHGLSAAHAAIAYGYDRIYKRERQGVASRDETELIGWRTDVQTKPLLVDRVREMLEMGATVPSEPLLRELKEQRYDENERIVAEKKRGHDDMMIALGIAYMVRERAYTKGLLRREPEKPKAEHEVYWDRANRVLRLRQQGVLRGRNIKHAV